MRRDGSYIERTNCHLLTELSGSGASEESYALTKILEPWVVETPLRNLLPQVLSPI